MEQVQKALSKGATGYFLFPMSTQDKPLTAEDQEIQDILKEYEDIFKEPQGLPPERTCDHAIQLQENAEPPRVRPYRVPHKQKAEMEAQVQRLLETSVIRQSKSPYASPAILVKKKDGTWRLCIDFRKLNS